MRDRDFYLAGKDVSVSRLVFSLLATIIGASSTIGLMGFTLSIGMPATLWIIFGSLGLFLLSLVYSKFFFEDNSYTIAEFLGNRYGFGVKKITSWVVFLSWIGIIAAQLIALRKLIDIFIPEVSSTVVLIFIILFLGLYTAIGGQRAVIITDRVQFLFFLLGFLAINIVLIKQGGFSFLYKNPDYLKFPINSNFSIWEFVYLALILIPIYITGPDMHSRIFCARDKRTIKRALNITALALLPLSVLIVAPAMMLYNIHGASSDSNILVLLFDSLFSHSYVTLLFLTAIICAILSSTDSCLMTSSTIFTRDILNRDKDNSITCVRFTIFSIVIIAFILSLYFKDIIQMLKSSYSIYTSSVFIPFILIPFKAKLKLKNNTIFISMIISGAVGGVSAVLGFKSGMLYAYLLSGLTICALSWLRR